MATIQVCKHGTTTVLGSGEGTIDRKNQTAAINSWTDKAGLVINTNYALKSGGKTYSDANCTAVNAVAPVATFNNVV